MKHATLGVLLLGGSLLSLAGFAYAQQEDTKKPAATAQEGKKDQIPLQLRDGQTFAFHVRLSSADTSLTEGGKEGADEKVASAKESKDVAMEYDLRVQSATGDEITLQVNCKRMSDMETGGISRDPSKKEDPSKEDPTKKDPAKPEEGGAHAKEDMSKDSHSFVVKIDKNGIIKSLEKSTGGAAAEGSAAAARPSGGADPETEKKVRSFLQAILGSGLHTITLKEGETHQFGGPSARPAPSEKGLDSIKLRYVGQSSQQGQQVARFTIVTDNAPGGAAGEKRPEGAAGASGDGAGYANYRLSDGLLDSLVCNPALGQGATGGGASGGLDKSINIKRVTAQR